MISEEERAELEIELSELLEWHEELQGQIAGLDRELGPYWTNMAHLMARGVRTHHWIDGARARMRDWRLPIGRDVVVGWRREGVVDRVDLFAQMDALAAIYGGSKSLRTEASKARRAVEKRIGVIRKLLRPRLRKAA